MSSGCWAARAAPRRPYIITEVDPQSEAILARSAWTGEFGGRIAFADLGGRQTSFTCDRTEFLGRNGSPEHPAALEPRHSAFGKSWGRPSIPAPRCKPRSSCARARASKSFSSGPGGKSQNRPRDLLTRYRTADLDKVLGEVTRQWDDILGTVQVTTPDPSMDVLLNRWLLYQTLSCRVWARAAFYQLSGAYGFRDQLQDVMALTVRETRRGARTSAARGRAPISRRRRPALVASAFRPRHSHAHVRRSAVAALRRRSSSSKRPAT